MFEKISQKVFIGLFFLLLLVPVVTTNFNEEKISQAENRKLKPMAKLTTEDGKINKNFTTDFENWINDNIGHRSTFVIANAKVQYKVFDNLSNGSNMYLGPNGELNYATKAMFKDYQHANLKSESELDKIAASFQIVSDYLKDQGIQFYYYQCWDKHSICPEQFPQAVLSYGDKSATDQFMEALEKQTTVEVINHKKLLIDMKSSINPYGIWTDPSHWTHRSSHYCYEDLMDRINSNNDNKYKKLTEEDYTVISADQGQVVLGKITKEDIEDVFKVSNPLAVRTEEAPIFLASNANQSRVVWMNENAGNTDTLVIMGDSYFDNYLLDDLAESFYKTVMIWSDFMPNLQEVIDTYHPAIIINENAERCDRSNLVVKLAKSLSEE